MLCGFYISRFYSQYNSMWCSFYRNHYNIHSTCAIFSIVAFHFSIEIFKYKVQALSSWKMMSYFLPIPISEFELVPYTYHLCEEESNFKQSLDKILDFLYEFKKCSSCCFAFWNKLPRCFIHFLIMDANLYLKKR